MNNDPISRLEFARAEVDRIFGDGYAAAHSDLVAAVMMSASSDWAAQRIAVAIEAVATALLIEDEAPDARMSNLVRASELVRP